MSLDPRTRLALVFTVGLMAISLDSPLSLGILAAVAAAPLVATLEGRWLARGAVAVAAVVWSTVLSQALFYADQPRISLVSLGPLTLWREGVVYGLAQSLRFVAVTLAGLGLATSTPPDRLYAALLRLRVPFGLALMAATALRFLPAITGEVMTVRRARASRGRPAWRRAPTAWLVLEISLLRPVIARAWRRAHNLAESLDARGFDPTAPRAVRRPLRLGPVDAIVLCTAALTAIAVVAARVAYLLYTADALYLRSLRPLYAFVRHWL